MMIFHYSYFGIFITSRLLQMIASIICGLVIIILRSYSRAIPEDSSLFIL